MLLLLMDVCVCGVCVFVCLWCVCVPPEAVSLGVCGVVCYVCGVCVCVCVLCVCVCMTPPPRHNLCAHVCVWACVRGFVYCRGPDNPLLYSHTRQPNAAKVWAPPRRIPKAVVFDANDAEHLDAVEAYVIV